MKVIATGAGTPRIVRGGPSSVKGTRRSFLTASQKRSPGPALERRSLYRPSGPDGKGQAKGQAPNARGEPPRPTPTSAVSPAVALLEYQEAGISLAVTGCTSRLAHR
jgi:hypothetical protein